MLAKQTPINECGLSERFGRLELISEKYSSENKKSESSRSLKVIDASYNASVADREA